MSNTVRNIEISKAEEVGAAIIDEQPQDYSIVQEWADKLGIELPQESAHVTPIKELSALVNGLVRKVLNMFLPQIVNKTEETYSHLDSRCTDYTPAAYAPYSAARRAYDPMRPLTPRTLPNLLTALTAFDSRKISNGSAPNDGIKDGVSLVHLLCNNSVATSALKIGDDNVGWTADREKGLNAIAALNGVSRIDVDCDSITANIWTESTTKNLEIHFRKCKYLIKDMVLSLRSESASARPNTSVYFDVLEDLSNWDAYRYYYPYVVADRVYLPVLKRGNYHNGGASAYYNGTTTYIYIGCMGTPSDLIRISNYDGSSYINTKVTDVEVRQGARQPITIQGLNGLTAENIVNHIFEKLADNTDGDPITINIGSANLAKLTDEQKAIAQNKNYTLA